MKEIYKEYPFDKRYKVSNKGNVMGLMGQLLKQKLDNKGYYVVSIGNIKARTHIFVAETFLNHKRCGHKIVVDHIDNNPENNNVNNLQLVSHRKNCSKDKKFKTSKDSGVHRRSENSWGSQVCLGGKVYYLGLYKTEYDAHIAYIDALNEYENFINE